jgi:NAD(P)-dependent dehydrogenase (short-subunit alcohol dehydrogenase family)
MRLAGKRAVVTGSSGGGLGGEIARMFASEGAHVIITGRSADRGATLAAELQDKGLAADFVRADLSERDQCKQLVEDSARAMGGLDILVNCAVPLTTGDDSTAQDVPEDVWNEMFAVNATAPRWLIGFAMKHLLATGNGSIVNVTSRTALRGTPNLAAYSSSKAALEGLTRSVAMDYGRVGVRCNAVAPGFITGKERVAPLPPEREKFFQDMHLTRMPTTQDVAYAVLYLASDESGAITGVTVPVDGGGSAVRGLTLG